MTPRWPRPLSGAALSRAFLLAAVLAAGGTSAHVASAPASAQGVVPPSVTRLTVQLSLRRAATAPNQAYVTDALLQVFSHNTSVLRYSATVRSDTTGAFTEDVSGLVGLSGTFDVVVKPVGALSRKRTGVTLSPGTSLTLAFGPFREGDADSLSTGSDTVNRDDANLVKSHFKQTCASGAPLRECADFNRDGRVTLLDVSLLLSSYGRSGPEIQT